MSKNFRLVNGDDGGPPETMEIKAADIEALKVFLNGRFKGLFHSCVFLSSFVGSQLAEYAKTQKAERKDCEDVLAIFHNAMGQSFEQVYARK